MKVKLSALKNLPAVAYSEMVQVALAGHTYEIIGNCKLSNDGNGELIGDIDSDRELSGDLFFYYTVADQANGIPVFTGLQLNEKERADSKTTQLKDMIIE